MALASRYRGFYDYSFNTVVTGSNTYERAFVFCFQGTDLLGVPVKISIIGGWLDNTTQSIRIYDITNNKVICERTDVTDEFPSAQDLGALSNLPEAPAIWEVQQKRPSGGGPAKEVAVASMHLEF